MVDKSKIVLLTDFFATSFLEEEDKMFRCVGMMGLLLKPKRRAATHIHGCDTKPKLSPLNEKTNKYMKKIMPLTDKTSARKHDFS